MCQNYLLFDEIYGTRVQNVYVNDQYFTFTPVEKPLHPSRLLEEKFWIHVESGFPLSGIGMKDMMERRTFNWSRQKDPYYNDIMGQILEDQKRMISYDLEQWYGLIRELLLDYAIPFLGIFHTGWSDNVQIDEPIFGPLIYCIQDFGKEKLYTMPPSSVMYIQTE